MVFRCVQHMFGWLFQVPLKKLSQVVTWPHQTGAQAGGSRLLTKPRPAFPASKDQRLENHLSHEEMKIDIIIARSISISPTSLLRCFDIIAHKESGSQRLPGLAGRVWLHGEPTGVAPVSPKTLALAG